MMVMPSTFSLYLFVIFLLSFMHSGMAWHISFNRRLTHSMRRQSPIMSLKESVSRIGIPNQYQNILNSIAGYKKKSAAICLLALSPWLMSSSCYASDDASKTAKAFELCLSKCVYQQTRPPPINSDNDRLQVVKERSEIIRGCKSECAVNKEQLLLGKPKQKKIDDNDSTAK